MTKPKIFVIILVIAVLSSVLAVTTGFQGVMASYITGYATEVSDTDIAEATEATEPENATIAGVANQTVNREITGVVEFLSIQSAQSGSISQVNATTYTLELNNASDSTILFSDRPERIVTSVSTSDFVGNWTIGPNSFAVDAPNDALIVKNAQTGDLETAVMESFNPVYDTNTNTLTYSITAENATSIDLPNDFGQSILVIDQALCAGCGGRQCPPC